MLRPATPDDRDELIALGLAEDAAWAPDATPVSAEEVGELLDAFPGGAAWEAAGRIAGYAAIGEGGESLLLTDPALDDDAALDALVDWLVAQGAGSIDTYGNDARRVAWLEAHGYAHARSSFDLDRPLEPALPAVTWPDGVTVARFRPGEDDAAVHELVYVGAAWAEVPGHTERTLDGWRAMVKEGEHAWVARNTGGTPVGWCFARRYADGRGWIQQLAVARSQRGQGLGRALLVHAMTELRDAGATSFALGVQAANERALGLYASLGFAITREFRFYEDARA
jgi:ribosomal protein S18 acetylase RimI-like enzyme